MKRGQYKESEIINKIKLDLSRDSSQRAKENAAIEYSDWFYNERFHDLSLANQKLCGQRTIDITGIDVNTAVKVQTSVVRAYTIADRMLAAHETIQHHHLIASGQINQQLLSQGQKSVAAAPTGNDVVVSNPKERIPARKGVTIDDCIVDIGEGKKAINCSGIQSRHIKDTSVEGSLQISQAVCNVLSLRETKDKNPYIANNIKVIDLSNCNLNGWDTNFFSSRVAHLDLDLDALYIENNPLGNRGAQELLCYNVLKYPVTHTLRHIDLSNCNLGYNGAVHFSTASKNWNRLESANLSNNAINDRGAMAIANAFFHGNFLHLKGLDFHGNKISSEGYGYLAKILETVPKQIQTQDIAITLEVHREQRSAWEFVKHAFNYIADVHSKKNAIADKELLVALYGEGEYAVCKKALADASHDIAVGMVKSMQNPTFAKTVQVVNRIPHKYAKIAATTGVFAYGFKDAAVNGRIFTPELAECIGVFNTNRATQAVDIIGAPSDFDIETHFDCTIL